MLPIAVYPSIVEGFLPRVEGGFSRPQLKQFARYLTGLIVCENKTVTGINNSFVGHNDQSALNNWLTESDWSEERLEKARQDLILEELKAKCIKRGVLVVDDTLNHKSGRHMEGVNIHYDHAEGRYTLSHQLVTSHLVAGRFSMPIGFELYLRNEGQEEFRSKQELARILIGNAVAYGFPFNCVVMDSWYFNAENASYIEGLGKDWVAACKSNRLILMPKGWTPISTCLEAVPKTEFKETVIQTEDGEKRFWTYIKNVAIRSQRRIRIVASYEDEKMEGEPKLIATNRLDWDVKTILKMYLKRWRIDSFYRDAKQELGLEDYEVRKMRGLRRHWLMVFLADTLLQLSPNFGKPVEWMKASLKTVGSRCRYAAMDVLRSFIDLVVKLTQKARTADEILRYTLSDLKELKTLYQMEIT
jgi:SRSO17 transposase